MYAHGRRSLLFLTLYQIQFVELEELKKYVHPDNLLVEYGGNDTFKNEYIPVSQRVGKHQDYVPFWEMPWATEGLETASQTATISATPSVEALEGDTENQEEESLPQVEQLII